MQKKPYADIGERSLLRKNTCTGIKLRPSDAGEIWKRSFISTVRPTVCTNPLRQRFSNQRNLKTPVFASQCIRKTFNFENRALHKRWRHENYVISLFELFSKTNSKWPVSVSFSTISDVDSADENIWYVFRVKSPFPYLKVVRTRSKVIICVKCWMFVECLKWPMSLATTSCNYVISLLNDEQEYHC